MASSGNPGAAQAKDLRVLLPFSCDSLRIPDELAGEIGAREALVVGPSGGKVKVWTVEVGQDGDGAFLGRGWPEFAAACGVGAGWLLVLRHRGRGVLTLKAFDSSCCLRELGAPPPEAEATTSSKDASRRPQFISVLPPDSMEKMLIPAKIVQQFIPKEHLNNRVAIVSRPRGKVCPIELEMNQSDVFFAGGLSQFLAFHGITEANALLLRYEGNMVFTVKVFRADGCQEESKYKDIRREKYQVTTLPDIEEQQGALSASIWKSKSKNNRPSSEGQKTPEGSMTSLHNASLRRSSVYGIGPPSWIKKQINANTLENELALAKAFCDVIGLREPCTITLKTSMNSIESWRVHGFPGKNRSYLLVQGWRRFCQENSLEQGDICTFNVVETTLWHVVITRYKERINQFCSEPPSASSGKPKSKNNRSSSEEQKGPKGSMTSLNLALSTRRCVHEISWKRRSMNSKPSSKGKKRPKGSGTSLNKASSKTKCVFEIGPPAWIKKEINTCSIENALYLPPAFCQSVGIWEPCMVTLKTSMSSTRSWQARVAPYKHSSHHVGGSGWKRFCQENRIKVGDVCTINILETTLWHVVITYALGPDSTCTSVPLCDGDGEKNE